MKSFRYKCYQSLYTTFGRVDSIVECIELSIRDFLNRSEDHSNFDKYIEERAEQNNIRVNTVNVEHLKVRSSQLHILNVFQQFEGYLIDLKKEIPFKIKLDEGNDSLFKRMLKALDDSEGLISQIEIDIVEYYRNIRNIFMHQEIESGKYDKKAERIRMIIQNKNDELKKYSAPNKYEELQFDDFILFTKISKDIAAKLCVVGCPSAKEIANFIRASKYYSRLNKYRNNKDRFERAAETLCRCEYSLDKTDSKEVVNELWALA